MKTIINRILFLIGFVIIWEIVFQLKIFPPLLFPSMFSIFNSFIEGILNGNLLLKTYHSLELIVQGMLIGTIIAFVLATISMTNKFFHQLIQNIIVFLYPIPGIALFPLAILWFGTGKNSIIFILLHSVIWSIVLNIISGIRSILPVYKEVGLNLGLSKIKMVTDIYLPACVPEIITGLKIALGRAWRTAISAEMVFGVVGSQSGLGWYMSYMRNSLDIAGLFSGLIVIVIIGIFFEDVLFGMIEKFTIKKWGVVK